MAILLSSISAISVEGKLANNGLKPFPIFAVREAEDVVFAEASAIQRETVAESAQVIEKVDCLVLWHGDPEFVAILHDRAILSLHKASCSKVLTIRTAS
jgi:hypothetical protein